MSESPRDAIRWEGVRFRYPAAPSDSLQEIDLSIGEGEFVLLTGPTGCGKSTLLKTVNGLIPRESAGHLEGSITLFGQKSETIPARILRSQAGLLFQNPDDQLICTRVQEEIAFGPENLGEAPDLIASRVESALACTGSGEKRFARCGDLSGGEKQRVALASVLSLGARLLALDEPTSQLDGAGVALILRSLEEVRTRLGVTVIIAEHRLDRILPMADRLIVMDRGSIRGDFRKGRFMDAFPLLKELGCETPPWMELSALAGMNGAEGEEAVCQNLKTADLNMNHGKAENHRGGTEEAPPLLRVRDLSHVYSGARAPALDSISCEVREGEILALMGHNGSGKTTLLSLFAGLLRLQRGSLERFGHAGASAPPAGRMGFLFQNPDLMLSMETVGDEVALGARLLRLDAARAKNAIAMSTELLQLETLNARNPFSLSRGERLRVALGALLAFDPQVLLLDEPTAGLDRGMRVRFLKDLRRWVRGEKGRAVVLCTHDAEAALGFADECLLLREGKVAATGPAEKVLSGSENGFPPEVEISPTARIARRLGLTWTPRTAAALLKGIADDD